VSTAADREANGQLGGPAAPSATPRDALANLLDAEVSEIDLGSGRVIVQSALPSNGYREFELPDGSFSYARENAQGDVVLVIRVVPVPGGWNVNGFTRGAC